MTISPQHSDVRLASGSDQPHFVVGGRYADTSFAELLDAAPTEGPFEQYEEAVDVWRANSMQHIDEAFVRYLIVQADSIEAASEHAEEPTAQDTARTG